MQLVTRTDQTSVLKHIDSGPVSSRAALANVINNAFLALMNIFTPLDPRISVVAQHSDTPIVTEFCALKKLIALNPAKASGPDSVSAWLLKENADLLAPVVTDILNRSYLGARLPQSWKHANTAPIAKQTPMYDVNKHLRPISLTPALPSWLRTLWLIAMLNLLYSLRWTLGSLALVPVQVPPKP